MIVSFIFSLLRKIRVKFRFTLICLKIENNLTRIIKKKLIQLLYIDVIINILTHTNKLFIYARSTKKSLQISFPKNSKN
jgi:hypothetical protein